MHVEKGRDRPGGGGEGRPLRWRRTTDKCPHRSKRSELAGRSQSSEAPFFKSRFSISDHVMNLSAIPRVEVVPPPEICICDRDAEVESAGLMPPADRNK